MIQNELVITRVVAATQAEVFDLFTDADKLKQWWWPHWPDTTYELGQQVGDKYRIHSPSMNVGVHGEITELESPWLYAYSWEWEDPSGEEPVLELVRIEISPLEDQTLITVRHWCLEWDKDDLWSGWDFVLGNLEQLCSTGEVVIEIPDEGDKAASTKSEDAVTTEGEAASEAASETAIGDDAADQSSSS